MFMCIMIYIQTQTRVKKMVYQNIINKYEALDATAKSEFAKGSTFMAIYEEAKKSLAGGIKANITNISEHVDASEGDTYFELELGDLIINGFVTDKPILCGAHDCTHQVGLSAIFMKDELSTDKRKQHRSDRNRMLEAIMDKLGLELEANVASAIAKAAGLEPKNAEKHVRDSRWAVIQA